MRVRLPLGVHLTVTTMNIRAPLQERRIAFARTVVAVVHSEGITQRSAFTRLNEHHPVLHGTFPSIEAFEMWISRNRWEVLGVSGDSVEIPTVFEDAGGYYEGVLVSELPDHVRLRDTSHPSTERNDRRERQEAERRIAAELIRELENDPNARERLAMRLARFLVQGE